MVGERGSLNSFSNVVKVQWAIRKGVKVERVVCGATWEWIVTGSDGSTRRVSWGFMTSSQPQVHVCYVTMTYDFIPNPSSSVFLGGSFPTPKLHTRLEEFCVKFVSLEQYQNMIPECYFLGFAILRLIVFRLINLNHSLPYCLRTCKFFEHNTNFVGKASSTCIQCWSSWDPATARDCWWNNRSCCLLTQN